MTVVWPVDELERIAGAEELRIAARRADGTLRRPVPIWVVCVEGQVYVRTWYRRDGGWFGHVLHSRRARIRVQGLEADVTIEDIRDSNLELRAGVDAAYRTKYARHGDTAVGGMVTDTAAATTLRLTPDNGARTGDDE